MGFDGDFGQGGGALRMRGLHNFRRFVVGSARVIGMLCLSIVDNVEKASHNNVCGLGI